MLLKKLNLLSFLISVGDATFNNLTKYELYPDIGIIDNLIQKEKIIIMKLSRQKIFLKS